MSSHEPTTVVDDRAGRPRRPRLRALGACLDVVLDAMAFGIAVVVRDDDAPRT